MARMRLATGSCPVCGDEVVRTISTHHGLATETYHCPDHGRREANPSGCTVAQWSADSAGSAYARFGGVPSMAMLSEMMDVHHPVPAWGR